MTKVNLMRRLDYWLGISLCLVSSIVLWPFLRLKNTPSHRDRVLLIELSEMGSAILADPAITKLKQHVEAVYFVMFKDNVKSLTIMNSISPENIYQINPNHWFSFIVDSLGLIFWCQKKKITVSIDFELFSRFSALLSVLSGAKNRIGFTTLHDEGCYRGHLVNHSLRYNPHVHISINFMSLVNRALGLNKTAYATFPITPAEMQLSKVTIDADKQTQVRQKIKRLYSAFDEQPLILINPNSSELLPQRRWMSESFVAVINKLLIQYPNVVILITGAANEHTESQKIINQIAQPRCINTAGVFEFSELVPLYFQAQLMLTNDSGPAHFAAATHLKVFVIFGPESPNLYLSLGNAEAIYLNLPCSPCVSAYNHRKTTCKPRPCISNISVDMVYHKIDQYLVQSKKLNSQ